MPEIFQYLNYLIRFYTNDHLPIHVHVQKQDRETKVEFQISGDNVTLLFKKVKGKKPLTISEANVVAIFLKSYYKEIIDKWEMVFI
jgi:ribosome-associated translation inhibitor RaiA